MGNRYTSSLPNTKLALAVKSSGFTQYELAAQISKTYNVRLSPSRLSEYLNLKRLCPPHHQYALARYFGIPLIELFTPHREDMSEVLTTLN